MKQLFLTDMVRLEFYNFLQSDIWLIDCITMNIQIMMQYN